MKLRAEFLISLISILLFGLVTTACKDSQATSTPVPLTPTSTPPTNTPAAVSVSTLALTPTPTRTPTSTPTRTLTPTRTRTPTPTRTRTPTKTPRPSPTGTSTYTPTPCIPFASFAGDVTIPDGTELAPGARFVKTWRMRSSGCAPWPTGSTWVFVSGNQMGAPASVSVPDTPLDGSVEISVEMVAPGTPGTYESYWQMQSPTGDRFGHQAFVLITVSAPTSPLDSPTATLPVIQSPTPVTQQDEFILYFYFGAQGCPYSRRMAPKVERFYQTYGVSRPFPDGRPVGVASYALPPIQISQRIDVQGVPVPGWGYDTADFRSATGSTFPIGGNPGLPVDTSRIPVTVLYNKQTRVHYVTTIGDVSYSTLVGKVSDGIAGRSVAPSSGGA